MPNTKLEQIIYLVNQTGNTILNYWPGNKNAKKITINNKHDNSKVTNADLLANEILTKNIQALYPNDTILSEEGELIKGNSNRFWAIDPIDGTSYFIKGSPVFSILVGLVKNTFASFGIMNFPALNKLVIGGEDISPTINDKPIQLSSISDLKKSSIYFRNCPPEFKNTPFAIKETLDSGYIFLKFIQGEIEGIVMKIIKLKKWDVIAPNAIIKAAGGIATDKEGKELQYLEPNGELKKDYIIVSNGLVHQQLLDIINNI